MALVSQASDSGGGSNFPQQGQVDWVQLSTSSISVTLGLLSRLSRGGVKMLTVGVTQVMASQFKLSKTGSQRMTIALKNLHGFAGIGEGLWFRFGIKHIVHDLATTNHGVMSLALVNAISEVHGVEKSADIMGALAEELGAPEELLPSPQQWVAIITACSGILASTKFSLVAENFMRFCDLLDEDALKGSEKSEISFDKRHALRYASASDRDIAKALKDIAQISRGNLESITLSGSRSCGWLAAVGDWFLSLTVRFVRRNGEVIFETAPAGEDAQIIVEVDTRISMKGQNFRDSQALIRRRAFRILSLHDFIRGDTERYRNTVCGKVSWEIFFPEPFRQFRVQFCPDRTPNHLQSSFQK